MTELTRGKITQVIGPVLDVEFAAGSLPAINSALKITSKSINDIEWNLVAEVAQHLEIGRAHV